jgi:phosphatidylglycerophosphate synthase
MDNKTSDRIQESISSKIEKRTLIWMASRLPRWMTPDHLTIIGFIGALLAGSGYALTNLGKGFLWLASFGFVVNWFGDSLDGTLARVRQIQRPRYGFSIDHNVDAITALVIVIGAGISPFVSFSAVLLVLVGYYLLCIYTYINTYLQGVLKISYSGFGPTELRLVIIIINSIFFFTTFENPTIVLVGITFKMFDLFALAVAMVLIFIYLVYFFAERKKYEKIDPPQTRF